MLCMTTIQNECMAAQVLRAIINGEPQPFKAIAEVSQYFHPTDHYVELFEDGSVLFPDYYIWPPERVKEHEHWPLLQNIIEAWQMAKEDAEMRALECPYDEA